MQAPGTHPALSTQMSSPACQLLFPLPILSHLPALHCTVSTANKTQHCQGAAEQARRRGTSFCFLLLSCLLEVHTCLPRLPFLLEVYLCLSFGTSSYGVGTLIPALSLKRCDLSLDRRILSLCSAGATEANFQMINSLFLF